MIPHAIVAETTAPVAKGLVPRDFNAGCCARRQNSSCFMEELAGLIESVMDWVTLLMCSLGHAFLSSFAMIMSKGSSPSLWTDSRYTRSCCTMGGDGGCPGLQALKQSTLLSKLQMISGSEACDGKHAPFRDEAGGAWVDTCQPWEIVDTTEHGRVVSRVLTEELESPL